MSRRFKLAIAFGFVIPSLLSTIAVAAPADPGPKAAPPGQSSGCNGAAAKCDAATTPPSGTVDPVADPGTASTGTASTEQQNSPALPSDLPSHSAKTVCGPPAAFAAACDSMVVTQPDGATPLATSTYQFGFGPSQLQTAYSLSGSSTQTIAIVDAYDNPNAASDLAAYRNQFQSGATLGTFTKVNQAGSSTGPWPSGNTGWGQEIDLDIEMASAICPTCNILLVEANSNSFADLGAAVNRAASMGAVAISNSYGTNGEFSGETSYDSYYNHPGIAITVSSGDSGYGVEFPAASNHVVAVGGTSLYLNSNGTRNNEKAWSGAGSGCSSQYSQPSWQAFIKSAGACSNRTVADVSAVADPNTGVAVYDSYGSTGGNNWYVFGGTSVASPIIAAVYALAGSASWTGSAVTGASSYPAALAYSNRGSLYDVTSGSNGSCVRGGPKKGGSGTALLCTAVSGYDGPTGLGTPIGTGAF